MATTIYTGQTAKGAEFIISADWQVTVPAAGKTSQFDRIQGTVLVTKDFGLQLTDGEAATVRKLDIAHGAAQYAASQGHSVARANLVHAVKAAEESADDAVHAAHDSGADRGIATKRQTAALTAAREALATYDEAHPEEAASYAAKQAEHKAEEEAARQKRYEESFIGRGLD